MQKTFKTIKATFAFILLAVALIFCVQNFENTSVNFIVWHINLPLFAILFGILITGFFIGYLFGVFALREKKQAKASRKTVSPPAKEKVEKPTNEPPNELKE